MTAAPGLLPPGGEVLDRPWARASGEVLAALGSPAGTGLTADEAGTRLRRDGPNWLPEPVRPGPVRRFLAQVSDPLVLVLLAAAGLALVAGDPVDAAVIVVVVLANAVVGFVQEGRAEQALSALADLVQPEATVVRDGAAHRVPAADVVVGDLVELVAGDRVPADLRLLRTDALALDESALTGEPEAARKGAAVADADAPLAERSSAAYAGTLVVAGTGRGVVVATGGRTELGAIARLTESADRLDTPLMAAVNGFGRRLTGIVVAVAAVTAGVGFLRGHGPGTSIVDAAAVAVAAIPEGLPAALTVTMAIGVARMARRGAVTRRLPTVETLGSTTVICTDKTGTLTQNRMTVRRVVTALGRAEVTGPGDAPTGEVVAGSAEALAATRDTLEAAVLASDAHLVPTGEGWETVGDPTETALLVAAAKAGTDPAALRAARPRTAVVPFDSALGWMAVRYAAGDGGDVVVVKGGLDRLLHRTRAAGAGAEEWVRQAERLSAEGMRVLAVARGRLPARQGLGEEDVRDLELLGLVASEDPPHPAVPAAVAACQDAGIAVAVITGDHAVTATAIARQVGIRAPGGGPLRALSGADLDRLDDGGLDRAVADTSVFARVTPEQKLRLVRALQRRGEVVAMTGDGVNDAPALRQADIGVAMGRGGTEAAKQAADLVLTDDDFTTIEAAVEEGRGVFDNVVKFLVFALPTNVGQALVVVAAVLAGVTLPLTAVQILWVNLVTAVGLGLVLAVEPEEPGIMARPPRRPGSPVLDRRMALRVLVVGLLLTAVAFAAFGAAAAVGDDDARARTAAMNAFVLVEVAYLFTCRSLHAPLPRAAWSANRWLLVGVAAVLALQLLVSAAPGVTDLLGTAWPTAPAWAVVAGVAAAGSVAVWGAAALTRRRPDAGTSTGRPERSAVPATEGGDLR
ncbi:cation-translocating P-type ATPase [Geodermatophilus sp. SYSU D00700]